MVGFGGGAVLIALTCLNQLATQRQAAAAQEQARDIEVFGASVRHAARYVVAQGMTANLADRWIALRDAALARQMKVLDWSGLLTGLSKSFRLLLQSLMIALGAWLVLSGDLTVGAMIAASILLGRALSPIEQMLSRWPQIQRARQGWSAIMRLLDERPSAQNAPSFLKPTAQVDVVGLTVTEPGRAAPVLFNVSFTIGPGEALGIIGRSGSGKTTVARALMNSAEPTGGEVRLGGVLLSQFGAEGLGIHVGFLPQNPSLLPGTIAENIARMSPSVDQDAVITAAQCAGAHDMILSLPDGYQTVIGPGASYLSGGQCQRVALARALYGDPAFVVLDEPNSALDAEGTEALNSAVRDMKARGRAVAIMTHRPMAISECDRLVVLDQGRVTASGPRDTVIRSMMRNANDVQDTLRARTAS